MPHRLDHREPFPEAPTPCSRTDVGDQVAAETVSRLSRSAARLRDPLSGDLHGISRQMRVARGRVDPPTNPIVQNRRLRFITVFIHSLELA